MQASQSGSHYRGNARGVQLQANPAQVHGEVHSSWAAEAALHCKLLLLLVACNKMEPEPR